MTSLTEFFQTPCLTLCVARSGSGKTTLLKYILYNLLRARKFDFGVVFSQTAPTGEWDILPEHLVFEQWNPEAIQRLIALQKAYLERHGRPRPVFVLLDDVLGEVNLQDQVFTRLATCGRHWGISVFLNVQKLTKVVPTVIRDNAKYIIVFQTENEKTLKPIYEEFASGFKPTFAEFKQWFAANIHSYRAFVINNSANAKTTERYRTIKAPAPDELPRFRIAFISAKQK